MRAAARNSVSVYTLPIDLFGRTERGWAIYAPKIAQTIGAGETAQSAGFSAAVAHWRRRRGLGDSGEVDVSTLQAMKRAWQSARPFVALRSRGVCPAAPPDRRLVELDASDSYGARPLQARAGALAAYRRMAAAARRAEPDLRASPELLQVFSAYRSPERDAARCAREANCRGVVRAACSAHRTGLAFDLVLDTAPGFAVDSSADANRLAMARGLAYRWLLANAARYGFVNYAFEPWHWEWTGAEP